MSIIYFYVLMCVSGPTCEVGTPIGEYHDKIGEENELSCVASAKLAAEKFYIDTGDTAAFRCSEMQYVQH